MKSNIFIPEKINVGFQNRSDTYTKKLAYIIYYDQKGVLRKETSWNSWRDDKIENFIAENVPTSGFVLNKKAGGYDTGWNHRQTYCRVYDPRGFEFEITIPNLLYILENTTSTKGKGLEGDFVYGWEGKDLVLLPTDSPDYKELTEFNKLIHSNNYIKSKDLIVGATYKTKANEEWVYMGRFDYWYVTHEYNSLKSNDYGSRNYISIDINKGKYHYFAREYKYNWKDEPDIKTLVLKSLGDKFISTVSTECVKNYAELFDKLECETDYSPLDESKDEYIKYTFEELAEKINDRWFYCYDSQKRRIEIGKAYNTLDKYYCKEKDTYKDTEKTTLEEIYNKLQPMYKNEYLQNGKLYREGK